MKKLLLIITTFLALNKANAQAQLTPYQAAALDGTYSSTDQITVSGPFHTFFEHNGSMYLQLYKTLYKYNKSINAWETATTSLLGFYGVLDYSPLMVGSTGNIAFIECGNSGVSSGKTFSSSDLINWNPVTYPLTTGMTKVLRKGGMFAYVNTTRRKEFYWTSNGTTFSRIPSDSIIPRTFNKVYNQSANSKSVLLTPNVNANKTNTLIKLDSNEAPKVYNLPTSVDNYNIFSDDDIMVVRQGDDSIFVYSYLGQTFQKKNVRVGANSVSNFYLMYMDASRIVALATVGAYTSQITSTDLGDTWTKQFDINSARVPVTPTIPYDNWNVGAGYWWALNQTGSSLPGGMLRSSDFGATWELANDGIRSFPALKGTNNNVWAINRNSQLIKTSDMQNWQNLPVDSAKFITMYEVSGNNVYLIKESVLGDRTLEASTDGGNSFLSSPLTYSNLSLELVANANNAILYSKYTDRDIYKFTNNGGQTWDTLPQRPFDGMFANSGSSGVYVVNNTFVTYNTQSFNDTLPTGLRVSVDGKNWQARPVINNSYTTGHGAFYADSKYLYEFNHYTAGVGNFSFKIDIATGICTPLNTSGLVLMRVTAVQTAFNDIFISDNEGLKVSYSGRPFELVAGVPTGSYVYKLMLFNGYLYAVTNNGMFVSSQPVSVRQSTSMVPANSVFPNPFTADINLGNHEVLSEASISDLSGKTIWTESNVPVARSLNMPHLLPGIYMLKATDSHGNKLPAQKLLKQ